MKFGVCFLESQKAWPGEHLTKTHSQNLHQLEVTATEKHWGSESIQRPSEERNQRTWQGKQSFNIQLQSPDFHSQLLT